MEYIIDFYKELDTLNLIIFWGIIIVIILLLIFSMILLNKNKKLKRIIEKQNEYEEELPIKKQEEVIESEIQEKIQESNVEETTKEKTFVSEDIVEYRRNLFEMSNNNQNIDLTTNKKENEVNMPNAPYQKNVLREMSLSQTSPIGINREINNNKKTEIAKDLNESLSETTIEKKLETKVVEKKETIKNQNDIQKTNQQNTKEIRPNSLINDNKQILTEQIIDTSHQKHNNEYLEEVSRKLAEAEIPNEIERTNYELKQEEEAIISYKELMAKKDTIQTVEEEDAIISIEELMNKSNKKEESTKKNSKLYNLNEEEENDNFIKELKQFRNDL